MVTVMVTVLYCGAHTLSSHCIYDPGPTQQDRLQAAHEVIQYMPWAGLTAARSF